MECNTSSDCQTGIHVVSRICFESAVFSDKIFFCDCATWYGWAGDNCDEVSGRLVHNRAMALFTLICFILLISLREHYLIQASILDHHLFFLCLSNLCLIFVCLRSSYSYG